MSSESEFESMEESEQTGENDESMSDIWMFDLINDYIFYQLCVFLCSYTS